MASQAERIDAAKREIRLLLSAINIDYFESESFDPQSFIRTFTKPLVDVLEFAQKPAPTGAGFAHDAQPHQDTPPDFPHSDFLEICEYALRQLNAVLDHASEDSFHATRDRNIAHNTYKDAVNYLGLYFQKAFGHLSDLQSSFDEMTRTAIYTGQQLEVLENERARADELLVLLRHYDDFNRLATEHRLKMSQHGAAPGAGISVSPFSQFPTTFSNPELLDEAIRIIPLLLDLARQVAAAGGGGPASGDRLHSPLGIGAGDAQQPQPAAKAATKKSPATAPSAASSTTPAPGSPLAFCPYSTLAHVEDAYRRIVNRGLQHLSLAQKKHDIFSMRLWVIKLTRAGAGHCARSLYIRGQAVCTRRGLGPLNLASDVDPFRASSLADPSGFSTWAPQLPSMATVESLEDLTQSLKESCEEECRRIRLVFGEEAPSVIWDMVTFLTQHLIAPLAKTLLDSLYRDVAPAKADAPAASAGAPPATGDPAAANPRVAADALTMYLHSLDAVHDIIRSWLALAVSCRGSVRSSLAGAGIAGPGAAGTAVGLLSDKETPEDFAEAAAASATSLALAADLEDSHRLLRATLAEHLNEERYCKIETRALKASFDRALLGFNTYRQTRRRAIEQAASQQRSFGLSLFGDSNNSPESDPEFLVIRRLGGVGQYWSDLTCAEITQSATESFRRMSRLLPRQAAPDRISNLYTNSLLFTLENRYLVPAMEFLLHDVPVSLVHDGPNKATTPAEPIFSVSLTPLGILTSLQMAFTIADTIQQHFRSGVVAHTLQMTTNPATGIAGGPAPAASSTSSTSNKADMAASSSAYRSCLVARNSLLSNHESRINVVVDRFIESTTRQLALLLSRQERSDYRIQHDKKEQASLRSDDTSAAVRGVITYISRIQEALSKSLDGINRSTLAQELGLRYHATLVTHLFGSDYVLLANAAAAGGSGSSAGGSASYLPPASGTGKPAKIEAALQGVTGIGGMALSRDLGTYRACLSRFGSAVVDKQMGELVDLSALFVVGPEQLADVVRRVMSSGVADRHRVQKLLFLRADSAPGSSVESVRAAQLVSAAAGQAL
ncbi:hypothetical protein H696_04552 [Fonticula alba]|uniref:Uncharacterized protein n=1 Tax=Fonticula alba TaxID=691883 RepID=A0A058Z6I1_FONAL|nr:hypothetical protein H696_04552 [Fonticula alba]KCV69137.1 hypothetical protein H696_04552 [Fonticula alba]|eukprot:XP_009496708.1 hypothetical protein H696_04552 [Fonticula alba]